MLWRLGCRDRVMNTSGEIRDDDTTIINTLTEQNSTGFNPQRSWPGGQTNITTTVTYSDSLHAH